MTIHINRLKTIAPLWVLNGIVVLYFLYGTAPDSIGPQGITLFFIIGYLFLVLTIHLLVLALLRFFDKDRARENWRISYALVAGFIPIAAVGFESLDQLVLRDLLIFFALVFLIIFYLSKRTLGR